MTEKKMCFALKGPKDFISPKDVISDHQIKVTKEENKRT